MAKRSLRIALFFSSNPTNTGGVQEHVLFLSEQLRKRGHSVTIFGPEGKCDHYKDYRSVGYTIQVPLPNGNWASVQMATAFSDVTKLIPARNFDILHIHEPYIPFLAWDVIDKINLPKVSTFHSAWDDNSAVGAISSVIPLFKERFSSKTAAAIFVSDITRKRWDDLCSRKVMKFVIPNAVDHDHFYPLIHRNSRRIKLLFLGRVVQRKGIHYLLRSVKNLLKEYPDVDLDIVGGGAEVDNTVAFIKRNRLEKNIHYRGEIFGLKRVSYFQRADLFCAPYFDEASPLTIIEAMSCGCPIIGFENESVKESLRHYPDKTLLVEQRNVSALTAALKKAIGDIKLRDKIRSWCISEGAKYSWEKVAEDTERVYLKVLEKKYA